MMFFRAIKDGRESALSLESMDLDYLIKYNEYLDVMNYLEKDIHRQMEIRNK